MVIQGAWKSSEISPGQMHQSFCFFTLNQRENEEKGKDELLMTYLGYRKATRHLLDDKFLYMESLLCFHCPSEGKENKQRIEPGCCHKELRG